MTLVHMFKLSPSSNLQSGRKKKGKRKGKKKSLSTLPVEKQIRIYYLSLLCYIIKLLFFLILSDFNDHQEKAFNR